MPDGPSNSGRGDVRLKDVGPRVAGETGSAAHSACSTSSWTWATDTAASRGAVPIAVLQCYLMRPSRRVAKAGH
jgi:hypothetical protein